MDLPAALKRAIDRAIARYFEDILPRYLTAYLRGGGYGFIAQMMQAHDERRVIEQVAHISPSRRSRRLALRVRAQCPVVVATGGLQQRLFGLFTRRATNITGEMWGSFREVDAEWRVTLFADSFLAVTPTRWDEELLLTVFHEYIHYFESFLLRSEQPLRSREEGHTGAVHAAPLTVPQAEARDRRITRRRRIFWAVVALLMLGLGVLMWRPTFDDDARLERVRAAVEQLEARHSALQSLADSRAAIQAETAPARSEAERRRRNDSAYDTQRGASVARTACPDAKVDAFGELIKVSGRGPRTALVRCGQRLLPTLAHTTPVGASWRPNRWSLTLRPALSRWPANVTPRRVDALGRPPTFQSDEGEALRARHATLAAAVTQLEAQVLDLRQARALQSDLAEAERGWLAALLDAISAWPDEAPDDVLASLHIRDQTTLRLDLSGPTARTWAEQVAPRGDQATALGGWLIIGHQHGFRAGSHIVTAVRLY